MELIDNSKYKLLRSPTYNYAFHKETGTFLRCGATPNDDPAYSPFGPEIADIEISKNGCSRKCAYCYKGNTTDAPYNMSLITFKKILDNLGPQLTQVAFGITDIKANPYFLDMMEYCRFKGIVPNFTTNGDNLDDDTVAQCAKLAGAVAVSYHGDIPQTFRAVYNFSEAGVRQVNIHCVADNLGKVLTLMSMASKSMELGLLPLNALVLLRLKPMGRAEGMTGLTDQEFQLVTKAAELLKIPMGFDSCSAHLAMKVYPEAMHKYIEPCESGLFSIYVNAYGKAFPCSFAERGPGYDLTNQDVMRFWNNDITHAAWRMTLLDNNRHCPIYFKEERGQA